MGKFRRGIAVFVLGLVACSADADVDITQTTIGDFDIAGDLAITPAEDRAPAPDGAQPVFHVGMTDDPAALDDLLAQADAIKLENQVVVTADTEGCLLMTIWALPEPDVITVGYEFDSAVQCVRAVTRRAIFIIDQTGSNSTGEWDYTGGLPTVVTERQQP